MIKGNGDGKPQCRITIFSEKSPHSDLDGVSRDGVCKTCDAVDDNIKGMYQLMAKWEELNKAMTPAYK